MAKADDRVATRAAAIRASPVVHLDETGWREAGRNGDVWTASTPAERLFVRGSRPKGMVDRLIGPEYAGVVVSDFSAASTHDDRCHQYCWAHLLRDIADLVTQHPDDATVVGWARAVGTLFARVHAEAGAIRPLAAGYAARLKPNWRGCVSLGSHQGWPRPRSVPASSPTCRVCSSS